LSADNVNQQTLSSLTSDSMVQSDNRYGIISAGAIRGLFNEYQD